MATTVLGAFALMQHEKYSCGLHEKYWLCRQESSEDVPRLFGLELESFVQKPQQAKIESAKVRPASAALAEA